MLNLYLRQLYAIVKMKLKISKMKYDIKSIINTGQKNKFLFFWGHQENKNNTISKSCLSQWYPVDFEVKGIVYKSAEHYMMAEKARLFKDEAVREKIIASKSPAAAKKLGRQVKNFDNVIWEENRYEIVKMGNYYKFLRNPEMAAFLLQTKNRILVEASPVDAIWGIGMAEDHENASNPSKWRGKNLLGFAMMSARDELMK